MKILIALAFLVLSLSSLANEIKVEISPRKPVAGEIFQAYFRIFTDYDENPVVNFDPLNLEIVGKSNQGVSTRTIYANGNLTVTREITLVYDLKSTAAGTAYLRNIIVQLGDKEIRHPNITLSVLNEPEELDDVFIMADVPKNELFIGEGIVVRYYLYSKVPVSNLDIKTYPKLNKFLKRFLQEPERTERVSVDGQIYMRTQIYAAKLYPEKAGELKIDSMRLSATYPSSRPGDPFGAFGLSRDFKTKTIESKTVRIKVKPLPEPVPLNFTGLVGKHDFNLQMNQAKLIVNQPLDIKLTVSGSGALENLEAPEVIKHPGLEEFETNGDLKISNADQATKVFDYTFLAKKNFKLPASELNLSYFDPDSKKYVTTQLNIPSLEVAGGKSSKSAPDEKKTELNSPAPALKPEPQLSAPLSSEPFPWKRYLPIINTSMAFLAVVFSLFWIIREKRKHRPVFTSEVPVAFKKGKFDLGMFFQWLSPIINKTGDSPSAIIRKSPLSPESKSYFIDLLTANDYKNYSSQRTEMEFKYRATPFKELSRYIESVEYENS